MGHNNLKDLQADAMAAHGIPKSAIARVTLADKFMQELLTCCGCLATVVHTYGPATLIDLMYLQGAIMKGTFIEHEKGLSNLPECLGELPSSSTWLTYVDVVEPE